MAEASDATTSLASPGACSARDFEPTSASKGIASAAAVAASARGLGAAVPSTGAVLALSSGAALALTETAALAA